MTATPERVRPIPASVPASIPAVVAQVARSTGELAGAISLPPQAYTSPEFYDFERDAVFGQSWVYLCHVSAIPNPGDFLAVTVAGEPLVVTRDRTGGVNVLSSLCRHRSFPVVDDAEKGNAKSLRCAYHYWSYDLDGSLLTAPTMEPAHSLSELRAKHCLPSFPVEVWNGFVFTHLGDDPEPLAPTLTRLDGEFAAHRTGELVIGESLVLTGEPWNWKNMLENALEAYHTSFLHSGYHENAPARLVRFLDFDAATENGIMRYAPFLQQDGGFLKDDGKAAFPIIEGLSDEQRGRVVYASVPPTLFVSMKPDSVMVFCIRPESYDRITLAVDWLFPAETLQMPGFADLVAQLRSFFDVINGQDSYANSRMFTALKSRFAARGPFAPQEATLPQLNGWLLKKYQAELARQEARA